MFIQLSYTIDANTPMYGGKEGFSSLPQSVIENGDSANTSKWQFPNHLGTHIDFPYHFYQNGQTVEDFPEEFWIVEGDRVQMFEVNIPKENHLIKPEHIDFSQVNRDAECIFLKTSYHKYRNEEKYWKYNPGISNQTTEWMKKTFKKLRIVGIDSISISSWQHRDMGRIVHKNLLDPKNPVLIIEDMDLSTITKDIIFKRVYIAPLMVYKSDGGPCTILAEVEYP